MERKNKQKIKSWYVVFWIANTPAANAKQEIFYILEIDII